MASSNAASDPSILAGQRTVYVGGLAGEVTPALLRAAMIPFGDIKSLDIPMDYQKGVHRGFGFVEYEDPDDASEAIFNMDGADLMGKTLKVSVAQPNQLNKLSGSQQAVWNNDEWFQQHVSGDSEKDREATKQKQQDEQVLTEAIH
jgi:peptidyl-prolyl isomerase E (cyclophilin E)